MTDMPIENVFKTAMILVLGSAILSLVAVLFMHSKEQLDEEKPGYGEESLI
jgi:hypothetical protein